MKSIFQRANPAILELFEKAGDPAKVMCIPIDYAKRQHTALVCNGAGLQLRGPFNLHNNPAGVAFLEEAVAVLRQWAQGRARPATKPEGEKTTRKIAT